MRISIIVPVYNAENYLPRCLNSLVNQGLSSEEMEVVCVDDGSSDGSYRILEEYAERYFPVFRLFKQNHAGLASARNLALENIRGEIVTFCDADDYLIPNGLSYILDRFWNDQLDVLCHASTTLDAQRLKTWKEDNDPTGVIVCEGSGRKIYERDPKYFVWNTLIRRSYIQSVGLKLLPLTMTEDSCFMLELMMGADHVVDVSSNIYRYTVNDTQITRQRDPMLMRKSIEGYLHFLTRLKHYNLSHVFSIQRIPFYSRALSARLQKKEYLRLGKDMKSLDLHTPPYWLYVLLSSVHRHVFVPFVLPHLRRG